MASAYTIRNSNYTRTFFLITVFVLLTVGVLYAIGVATGNRTFTYIGLAIGIIQPLIGLFFGDKIALGLTGAKQVQENDNIQLHEMIGNLARTAGIPKPKIYISPDPSPNAFATGRSPNNASVCFNQGLLNMLNKSELEGVAAHELAHIKNRDTLVMTMAAILASVIGFIADFGGRMMMWGGANRNEGDSRNPFAFIIYIVVIMLAPIVAFLLQMAISRSREYLADATAVTYTRYPEGLKNALLKLHNSPVPATTAHSFTNHLYISEPKKNWGQRAASLFSTHPPIELRIKNLDSMGVG